jgi:hypothetical protein
VGEEDTPGIELGEAVHPGGVVGVRLAPDGQVPREGVKAWSVAKFCDCPASTTRPCFVSTTND